MKKLLLAAAAVAGLAGAVPAQAVVISLTNVVTEGSNFRYNYEANFSADEGLRSGSTFAIFDFAGLIAGSVTTNPLFTASTPNTSNGLSSFGFTDDASTPNLQFTYNGPDIDQSNLSLIGFSALSRFGSTVNDGFSAVTLKTNGAAAGTLVASQGAVGVPNAVPEPAAWAMMIGGFGLVGGAARRRQTVKTVVA